MYWTELKRALLYGQPAMSRGALPPQTIKTAVRDIVRLIGAGWIDHLTEDVLQRIQTACQIGQCPEIWEEFRGEAQVIHCCRKAAAPRKKLTKRGKPAATARQN